MKFKNHNQRKAVMAKLKGKPKGEGYYHVIGIKEANKKGIRLSKMRRIDATSWDGKEPVRVYYPIKPSKYQQSKVRRFLLSELDDHESLNKFNARMKRLK